MNKKIVIGVSLSLCGAFYIFWSLRKDLALVDLLTQTPENLTVTLQNIETTRQSGKDLWRVKAQTATRSQGRDDLTMLRAESTGEEGSHKQLEAPSGVHYPDRSLMELASPSGKWNRSVGSLTWRADQVSWQQEHDLWTMTGNITAQDQRSDGSSMNLEAPSATFRGAGYLIIDQPSGNWLRDGDTYTLTAPVAHWEQIKDQWTFPKGLKVVSSRYDLTAQSGQVDQGAFLSVQQGQLVWRSTQQ